MTALDRVAWIAVGRLILDLVETDPELPLPMFTSTGFKWGLYASPTAPVVARIEAALPCELSGLSVLAGNEDRCVLAGVIDGIPVIVEGWTSDLAERRVTGTTVVEQVEWVRLPAQGEAPESGASA